VHDAHAAQLTCHGAAEEAAQCIARLVRRQAMQIDLAIQAVDAAAQLAHHAVLDAGAPERQFVAGFDLEVGSAQRETFFQHGALVRTTEMGARPRFGAVRNPRRMSQGLDPARRLAEGTGLFIVRLRRHATSRGVL
jgi:hypothetical protein